MTNTTITETCKTIRIKLTRAQRRKNAAAAERRHRATALHLKSDDHNIVREDITAALTNLPPLVLYILARNTGIASKGDRNPVMVAGEAALNDLIEVEELSEDELFADVANFVLVHGDLEGAA